MSLEGSTLSPRRLAVLAAIASSAVLVVVVVAARLPDQEQQAASVEASPRAAPVVPAGPEETREPTASPEPDAEPIPEAEDDSGTVDEGALQEEAAAHQVATDFAARHAEYRFDDPPAAALERVRPFVTDELAAELGRNSGALAARAELQERQERALATVQAVQRQGGAVADGRIDLLVVVRQDVTWTGGSEIRWPSYVVQVVRTDAGWRVARVLL